MINIIRDLPILCNVKWEEPGRNEVGVNGSEAVGRGKEGWDIVSYSLLSGIPHISLDNPCIYILNFMTKALPRSIGNRN